MLLGRPRCTGVSNVGRPLHFGISNVSCCSAKVTALTVFSEDSEVLLASSEDSEESSFEVCSSDANVLSSLAFSCMPLNLEAMIGSIGAIIIIPNTTQSAPVILPAEIEKNKT